MIPVQPVLQPFPLIPPLNYLPELDPTNFNWYIINRLGNLSTKISTYRNSQEDPYS